MPEVECVPHGSKMQAGRDVFQYPDVELIHHL